MSASATAVGLAGLLAAVGARRPVLRRWPVSVLQAAPCGIASEAPGALSVGHAALAVAAALGGSRVGTAANLAALAALDDLRRDADRSAAVLREALVPLGVEPVVPVRPGTGRWRALRRARTRLLRAVDVRYGDDPAQRLDVWAHPDLDPSARAPVLVQVHGGGWTGGTKTVAAVPLTAHLAERGWVVVSIDYRLAPAHRWPAMIVDVKRAIAWTRDAVAGYGGDPGFVAISGGSAGAHLAALAALTPNDPAFQPGFTAADTSLAAAVPCYGVFDFGTDEHGLFRLLEDTVIGTSRHDDADTWRRASPLHRVGPHAPPFLVVHGSTDTVASAGQSRRLVAALREVATRPVLHAELPRAQHGFDGVPTARTAHLVCAVHAFLTAVHERYRSGLEDRPGAGPVSPESSAGRAR